MLTAEPSKIVKDQTISYKILCLQLDNNSFKSKSLNSSKEQ